MRPNLPRWLGPLFKLGRRIRRLILPLPYGGEPVELVIDLRGVSTQDTFRCELGRHFGISPDEQFFWHYLSHAIVSPSGPRYLRFLGWDEFERRMPRYARRLKRILSDHFRLWGTQKVWGVKLLAVEFA